MVTNSRSAGRDPRLSDRKKSQAVATRGDQPALPRHLADLGCEFSIVIATHGLASQADWLTWMPCRRALNYDPVRSASVALMGVLRLCSAASL
jgi:hypothetical protein